MATQSFSSQQYPSLMKLIHWATLIFIVLGVSLVLIRDAVEGKPLKLWLLNIHKTIGLLIPTLLIFRVLLVVKYRQYLPVHALDRYTKLIAKIIHIVLYFSLILIPLLGWAYVSAKGQAVNLLGLIRLPSIVPEDMDLADQLGDWHQWAAYSMLALVAVHALAALWHHFVKKDNVLRAMAPQFNLIKNS